MWDKNEYNFGIVQKGNEYFASFNYLGAGKIEKVETSCQCLVASHTDKTITVKYKAPAFPEHLPAMGITETVDVKTVKVSTKQGQHTLTIKAILQK